MPDMDSILNAIGRIIRSWMRWPALALDKVSGGHIRPNHVTLVSLLGHGAVVWALWNGHPRWAALFLAFFGIMDTLDGALAKVQRRTTLAGMFYDAVSDRAKEVLVYTGLILFFWSTGNLFTGWDYTLSLKEDYNVYWSVVAVCGLSLLVSYVKAKGEMALSAGGKHDAQALNRLFSDGLARYEVRMALIIIGLLTNTLLVMLHVLLVLLIFTVVQRVARVSKALKNV
jgi:phosphatidylglycerophosphate synthase